MQKLADVAAETDLGDLDNVVPAQVGRVAESALRQAPDAVVGQVEPLELVEVAQGLGLQLHRHAARPLRVVTLDDERGERVKTVEGSRGGGTLLTENKVSLFLRLFKNRRLFQIHRYQMSDCHRVRGHDVCPALGGTGLGGQLEQASPWAR